jgi:hypothetical protein
LISARHFILVVVFALAGVFACSSNEARGTEPDAAPTCVQTGESCGACCPQYGHRYDEARDCVDSRAKTNGCSPIPASTTACAYLGVTGCAATPDGVWFTSDRAAAWAPAEKCSDALAAKVQAAKPCPTTDAGAEAGL